MEIRRLASADAAAFRALRLRGLRESPESFTSSYEEDAEHPLQVTQARLADPGRSFWGAFRGGDLCGIVGLERESRAKNRHKAHLVGMFVAAEARGEGAGRRLVEALLATARAEGLALVVLTVTEGNAAAQRLYESCGFRTFGIEPRAVRIGERFLAKNHMALTLDPA